MKTLLPQLTESFSHNISHNSLQAQGEFLEGNVWINALKSEVGSEDIKKKLTTPTW